MAVSSLQPAARPNGGKRAPWRSRHAVHAHKSTAELVVHTTVHDLTGLSALWEYLNARISLSACHPGK